MNTKLKLAFIASGITQYEAARALGASETRVSRIVQGRVAPTEAEKGRLAEVLARSVEELFGETDELGQ